MIDNILISGKAYARVNLLGNPSDIYGGFGLGFPISNWSAEVFLDQNFSPYKENKLLDAARAVFSKINPIQDKFGLRYISDIPMQCGLAGSSALVMAALRALGKYHDFKWTWKALADATLIAERENLGIIAGPMDRWIQAREELLWMNFSGNKSKILSLKNLPSFRILISSEPGQSSGSVHSPVMERWNRGDPEVKKVMDAYGPLVERGLSALISGDILSLAECMDQNFELRASLFPINEKDKVMIDLCRKQGAAAKLCGSGGAVIALMKVEKEWDELEKNAKKEGVFLIKPQFIKGR